MFDWSGYSAERALYYFEQLCAIPHPSRYTKAVSDYCVQFAKDHGLWWRQDEANNVIIRKPASPGRENCGTVMLQGHLDMVPAVEEGRTFDFTKDPLELKKEGDFLSASGTTLGADDGIAIAYCLAILESEEISHPSLICVFTTEEEIGMLGAQALDFSDLKADYLLNMDMEEEGSILLGCAGGGCARLEFPLKKELPAEGRKAFCLNLTGLRGGHSGTEIIQGYSNGIRVMATLLESFFHAFPGAGLADWTGGNADNAIPSSSRAAVVMPAEQEGELKFWLSSDEVTGILASVRERDPDVSFTCAETQIDGPAAGAEALLPLLQVILGLPNGVQAMSREIPDLVETSLNTGVLAMGESIVLQVSVRSSLGAERDRLLQLLKDSTESAGGSAAFSGIYPGWPARTDSELVKLACRTWEEQTGSSLKVEAVHAGLECGIFSQAFPEMDIIAYGPKILDIHTPKERLSLSSTDRIWEFTAGVLKNLP